MVLQVFPHLPVVGHRFLGSGPRSPQHQPQEGLARLLGLSTSGRGITTWRSLVPCNSLIPVGLVGLGRLFDNLGSGGFLGGLHGTIGVYVRSVGTGTVSTVHRPSVECATLFIDDSGVISVPLDTVLHHVYTDHLFRRDTLVGDGIYHHRPRLLLFGVESVPRRGRCYGNRASRNGRRRCHGLRTGDLSGLALNHLVRYLELNLVLGGDNDIPVRIPVLDLEGLVLPLDYGTGNYLRVLDAIFGLRRHALGYLYLVADLVSRLDALLGLFGLYLFPLHGLGVGPCLLKRHAPVLYHPLNEPNLGLDELAGHLLGESVNGIVGVIGDIFLVLLVT